jgi:predicted TIM-barrel fold metal-dependent hydrolase
MTIIDAHNHLIWPHGLCYSAGKMSGDASKANSPHILDPQTTINAGVIQKMWVLSTGNCVRHPYPDVDEALLELARKYPDFIVPFAYLDFEKSPHIVDDFKRRGFAGLKAIFPHKPYDDESFFPFYEKAEKHHMPILFHVGGAGYDPPDVGLFTNETFPWRAASRNMLVITLDLIAKIFPKMTIIAAHAGGRDGFERCLDLARSHPSFYFDLSCSPLERGWRPRTQEAIEYAGADSILFGSDSRGDGPTAKALDWKSYLESASWSRPEYVTKILSENAERIIAESGYDPANMH